MTNKTVTVSNSTVSNMHYTTYQDERGGEALMVNWKAMGMANTLVLRDKNETIAISTDSAGYAEKAGKQIISVKAPVRPTFVDFNTIDLGDKNMQFSLPTYHSKSYGVSCVNHNHPSVTVVQDVADSVLRERVQAFAKKHPELVEKIAESGAAVAHYNGKEVGMNTVLQTPAHFEACPASGEVVKKWTR